MGLEDFTTYTELDPGADITITSTKTDIVDLPGNATAYVYDDKGVNHFDGDFEFLFETLNATATQVNGLATVCCVANVIKDRRGMISGSDDALMLWAYRSGAGLYQYYLEEMDSGTRYQNATTVFVDADYFMVFERDETIGTYGTIYAYFYNDSARTSLAFTASIALHSSKKDFRYIYSCQSDNAGLAATIRTYCKDLDLQEATTSGFQFFFGTEDNWVI